MWHSLKDKSMVAEGGGWGEDVTEKRVSRRTCQVMALFCILSVSSGPANRYTCWHSELYIKKARVLHVPTENKTKCYKTSHSNSLTDTWVVFTRIPKYLVKSAHSLVCHPRCLSLYSLMSSWCCYGTGWGPGACPHESRLQLFHRLHPYIWAVGTGVGGDESEGETTVRWECAPY